MSLSTISRAALARQQLSTQLTSPATTRALRQSIRNASSKSSKATSKPIILEKPDRFRPPSHPQRIVAKPRQTYGPSLTEDQKKEMKTKQYPHMMPPEGSFMHWFITTRWIHVWISMGVLFSLTFYIFIRDFLDRTPYRDLLPPRSDFLSHPFSFISQWVSVYKMSVEYNSELVKEKRRKSLEDVQKQKEYRKAHGMPTEPGFLSRLAGNEGSREVQSASPKSEEPEEITPEVQVVPHQVVSTEAKGFDGQPRKPVKRWFGIWE